MKEMLLYSAVALLGVTIGLCIAQAIDPKVFLKQS